jgi:pimeloyl-ACP methyl ester carboxylesterase
MSHDATHHGAGKTFVLVHGAWHGSWCWSRVRKALQSQGHSVFTPTLTGVGERVHLLTPQVNLTTHVLDVVNLLKWEDLSDVVLCGHSYGGAVISGVADLVPTKISALVYLDAFVLEDGESVHDTLPKEHSQMQKELAREHGEGWKVPPIPAVAFNVNEADREWVDRQCTAHPIACFQERLKLSGAGASISEVHFIQATDYADSPFAAYASRARSKGWRVSEVACGHDVMLDRPEELTNILRHIAKA